MSIKLLVDPVYTITDTRKCITHYALDSCARHVLTTQPDAFVYYLHPDKGEFEKKLEEDFPGRVKYFSRQYFPSNRVYDFLWQPEWLKDLAAGTGYAWDWDLLLTTRGPGMIPIRITNWPKSSRPRKIIIHDHFPFLDFKVAAASFFTGFPNLNLVTLVSYVLSDRIVVGSQYEVDGIIQNARRFLAPSQVKMLAKKVITGWVVPRGLDLDYPLKKKLKKKGDVLVGIFTQRIGVSGRHPELVFDAFMYPFVKRKLGTVEFQLSTNSLIDIQEEMINKYRFVKTFKSFREEFYERLRESDFCISFSTTESIPTSILEAICWGCIPVLIKSKWSIDMVGPDYEFLFETLPVAVKHIEKILADPSGCQKRFKEWYVRWWIPFLEKNKALVNTMTELSEEHERDVVDLYTRREKTEITQLAIDYVKKKGIERVTLIELYRRMFKDKVIRVPPDSFPFGEMTQMEAGKGVPYRQPKPYQMLHSILLTTGWKRGLEVGEIVIV